MSSLTDFETVKQNMTLMFAQSDYVSNITDTTSGPMAMSTIQKWDKRQEGSCKLGDLLPETNLPLYNLTSNETTELHSLFTEIADEYVGVIDVAAVYISEAHSTDEWALYSDVDWKQPKKMQERVALATKFAARLHGENVPLYVDELSNAVGDYFAAWPERLYIIDGDGKIGYKGELGPDGYKPEEVKQWLVENLQTGKL